MKKLLLMFSLAIVIVLSYAFYEDDPKDLVPGYVGTQGCVCHSAYITSWKTTLHSQIHMTPGPNTVRPGWTGSINMGSSYGNATVSLTLVGNTYKATLNPSSGSPVTYDILYTYGGGWKQRYLVKISQSLYILPIQYNLAGYQNNSSGSWITYNPGNWFNTDGTLKAIDNAFRKKAYDKNCSGCHITGNDITKVISGPDTSWTSTWANSSDTTNNKTGCETCHGPGSDHVSAPSTSNIFGPTRMQAAGLQRQQEVCGQCHFRGASPNLTYEYPWKESVDSIYQPGQVLANYIAPWQNYFNVLGGPGVWPDTMTARQHHQQWQDMSYSPHNNIMNCYKCHDPHQIVNGLPHQLKLSSDSNNVCLQCHTNFGNVGNPNISAITAHTKHSYDPLNQNQTGGASRCVNCHMSKVAITAFAYDISSHSWRIIPPVKTLQKLGVSSPTQGMANTCAIGCHRNPGSASGTGNVPNLGVGTDPTLTNWREPTDSLLADTLNRWYIRQNWPIGVKNISGEIPDKYILNQNYPNPFNPNTKINFSLPKTEFVTMIIYDITGRVVYKLIGEKLTAGNYTYNWNSINNDGDYVSSGVYFYRITAGDFIESKKMILVR
jgi:predicted CXXCH cytochrome family protein